MLFKLLKIIYGYSNLLYTITKIYYYNVDLNNNPELICNLKKYINCSGSMCIKSIQWLLPRYKILYPDNLLINEFSYVFDNCDTHSISYTCKKYKSIFNHDIYDKYKIEGLLGSGSIGQVYLIEDKLTKEKFAMKILHPNLYLEYIVFFIFYKLLSYFINIQNYFMIEDISLFVKELKNQLDLRVESNNMNYFSSIYDKIIVIPKVYSTDNDILIMEYIDGIKISEISKVRSEYTYYKYVALLSLFIFNNGLSNSYLLHGDLHIGNYLVDKDKFKLTILDFGYCFKVNLNNFKILFNLFHNPSKQNIIDFFDNLLDNNYNQDKRDIIISKYHIIIPELLNYKKSDDIVIKLIKFSIENKLILPNEFLNTLLLFLQLSDVIEKSNLYTNESTTKNYLNNFCETYNICDSYYNYMKTIQKKELCTENNKFNKFESLKKYL